jgi:hypothetical protein
MDAFQVRVETPLQALMVEQALVLAKQLEQTAAVAPHGKVLARLEQAAVSGGREFVRRSLEKALQVQADDVEKKLLAPEFVRAVAAAATKAPPGVTS